MRDILLMFAIVSMYTTASTVDFYDQTQYLVICDTYNNEIQSCKWESLEQCEYVTDGHAKCGYYDDYIINIIDKYFNDGIRPNSMSVRG